MKFYTWKMGQDDYERFCRECSLASLDTTKWWTGSEPEPDYNETDEPFVCGLCGVKGVSDESEA